MRFHVLATNIFFCLIKREDLYELYDCAAAVVLKFAQITNLRPMTDQCALNVNSSHHIFLESKSKRNH